MTFDRPAYMREWRRRNRDTFNATRRAQYRANRLRRAGVDPERLHGWLHELSCGGPPCRCAVVPVYRKAAA